jgi:integrase
MKLVMLVATHLDVFTGLRRGELIGLKWEDIDFEVLAVKPKRSVVNMVGGKLKTEESGKSIPLDVETAEILLAWKRQSLYNQPSDWVFASPIKNGAQPYWPDSLWKRYGRPAFVAAGVTTPVAYHTFRHSLATLMMANGEDVKTVQTMLRHATSAITLNTYAHGVTSKQREAQNKVVAMVRKASA